MIESKAWNWNDEICKYWKNVSDEFLPIALKWKEGNLNTVLDLGCGIGRNALYMARTGFNVHAFDLSKEGLSQLSKEAKLQNLNIQIKIGDMLNLPYSNNFFDCLLAFHSIYHTDYDGLKRVISEIYRVLKKNGEIYVTLNSKESDAWITFSDKRINNYTLIKTEAGEIDVPHTYLDYNDATGLLSNFKILKIQQIFDYHERKYAHFFILCRKK
ncbi:MAG: class I SAM-dependent methyltransferase [Actinobacteria bacterium]|nr:class I SAM-dependent methyltransferase [Chloroflexota bacterium]MBE3128375.1 class I SAM-dependent methyltransferase [Actinomycetota bacterium]